MIYAQLSVFSIYAAFLTADSEGTFLRVFQDVVHDCVRQYEETFGDIGSARRDTITSDLARQQTWANVPIDQLSFDMKIDGDGCRGVVEVIEVFHSSDSVIEHFQPIVDDLNREIEDEDEKWSVFDGFFPITPGYEIDVLFK